MLLPSGGIDTHRDPTIAASAGTPVVLAPRTTKRFTPREFADLRRAVDIRSRTSRAVDENPRYATEVPDEVSLQLTYRCNLRCSHCYQWSEQGFFRDYSLEKQRSELDLEIVEDVLRSTYERRSKLYVWGGEPLMHTRFPEVAQLLGRYPRTFNLCTNGLLLERNLPHLRPLAEHMHLLVSIDGLGADHDALRGKGTFARTVRNLQTVLDLQRAGDFPAEIAVECMVSNETVGRMYEFAEWAEELGLASVYFLFPWFISPQVATAMDDLYARCFDWLSPPAPGQRSTWHSYTYRLRPDNIPVLRASLARLQEREWNLRLRYQPQLEDDEIEDFVLGTSRPAQRRSRCLSVSNRMEVHADGQVSSCKFFPEFVVGDLHDQPMLDLWHNESFVRVREVLREEGLMPVCSKCIALYMNGE